MTDQTLDDPIVASIVAFLREIGLDVRMGTIEEKAFVPGILIDHGGLLVDPAGLTYPGDLLHEAGHLAVVAPERRARMHRDAGKRLGEEMMAIGWSYAAAVHLGIDPAVVFHEGGYRGGGQSFVKEFAAGRYLAVPTLQWIGLTRDEKRARAEGGTPYPHMHQWLRTASAAELGD
jgi:hypothetical protein